MKRFKQMAAMLLFALLTAGFTSSAMADDPFSHLFDRTPMCTINPQGVEQPIHLGPWGWPWCW